jgi:hypothetical protein
MYFVMTTSVGLVGTPAMIARLRGGVNRKFTPPKSLRHALVPVLEDRPPLFDKGPAGSRMTLGRRVRALMPSLHFEHHGERSVCAAKYLRFARYGSFPLLATAVLWAPRDFYWPPAYCHRAMFLGSNEQ